MSHSPAQASAPEGIAADVRLNGRLWIYIAFDWGDEIDLEHARRLAPAPVRDLLRRSRTPTSFVYKPQPLDFPLPAIPLSVPGLPCDAVQTAHATVFDIAAVNLTLQVPLRMTLGELTQLAGCLAEPETETALMGSAVQALLPLFDKLKPALDRPHWQHTFNEQYFVFQFPPGEPLTPELVLGPHAGWLAGLVLLEDQPLSEAETAETARRSLRYNPYDLLVADWGAAFLLDRDPECTETLQTVELANVQLLEYRHIDDRLDESMKRAQKLLHRSVLQRLPMFHSLDAPVRVVGELKVEAADLFERTGSILKLVGGPYLARIYRLLSERFSLPTWERGIQRKLDILEGTYRVLADQATSHRTEFLEIIVVILITLEIVLPFFFHK
jgi:hypothetical protein